MVIGNCRTNADVDALMERIRSLSHETDMRFRWADDGARRGSMYTFNMAHALIAKARKARTCAMRGHWLALAIENLERTLAGLPGEGAYRKEYAIHGSGQVRVV